MSDINQVVGNALYSDQDHSSLTGTQTTVNTGALRRKYNFGDYVSELALAQDPFFRFVSMVSKKPTDDPTFKFTEKRSSYTKRYAYLALTSDAAKSVPDENPDNDSHAAITAGEAWTFSMFTDYNFEGNLQNIKGKTCDYYDGVTGTQPKFFIPGQIVKINTAPGGGVFSAALMDGYTLWKINSVDLTSQANHAVINATCLKGAAAVNRMPDGDDVVGAAITANSQEDLEPFKCYVVGTSFAAGTGYPETWADQPYTTSHGLTQIWKTSAVMNNTDRATVLKYEGNEWARIWKEKLIEHKWDIENSLLFSSQQSTVGTTTQGAVDFISTYGNSFGLTLATKTQDSFLDDLSALLDPRYNNASATVFFCSTAVYNWLHKLSGYYQNNIEISPNFRADFSLTGKKKVFGIDVTTISTIYGDMNVVRNVHLDGTNVKILGINMKYCAYRPLVGNGLNRDTGVYVGVQTLENSGVDRRVDQILTEAGMEWCCPETHAIWI